MDKPTKNNKSTDQSKEGGVPKPPSHHFVVDSGLKNIIGQELITNDFVAIY